MIQVESMWMRGLSRINRGGLAAGSWDRKWCGYFACKFLFFHEKILVSSVKEFDCLRDSKLLIELSKPYSIRIFLVVLLRLNLRFSLTLL